MRWKLSHRFDRRALPLANRHYNRRRPDSPQFVAPGRNIVLLSECERALWVSRVQLVDACRHAWAGAWECALFRNEGAGLSSELIQEAVAATLWMWGVPPPEGFITFVDRSKTKPKKDPGFCYRVVGWEPVGRTVVNHLHVLRLQVEDMPSPLPPLGAQGDLFNPFTHGATS